MAKRRRTDNTTAKRRRTDNTMAKKKGLNNHLTIIHIKRLSNTNHTKNRGELYTTEIVLSDM